MRFPKEENWSGLPFPFPGDLPHPGMEPATPAVVREENSEVSLSADILD